MQSVGAGEPLLRPSSVEPASAIKAPYAAVPKGSPAPPAALVLTVRAFAAYKVPNVCRKPSARRKGY